MQRFKVFTNDLLISCSGTMGKIAIVPAEHKPGIITQALLKLTSNDGIMPEFVKLYLETAQIQQRYFQDQSGAAIQNVVSVKELKQMPFPNVSIETQREIVARISEEMSIVEQNKRLVEIFRQKVRDKIADVWGASDE